MTGLWERKWLGSCSGQWFFWDHPIPQPVFSPQAHCPGPGFHQGPGTAAVAGQAGITPHTLQLRPSHRVLGGYKRLSQNHLNLVTELAFERKDEQKKSEPALPCHSHDVPLDLKDGDSSSPSCLPLQPLGPQGKCALLFMELKGH